MAGFRSLLVVILAGVGTSLLLPARHLPRQDLDLVETGHGLSIMRHEVSIRLWQACVDDGACHYQSPPGRGATGGDFPVTGVGALDAQEFVSWARRTIDPALRLPTLAEWSSFSGVVSARPRQIFTDPRLAWAASYGSEAAGDPTLRPPGGFGMNERGIADVKGNVWEWTSTCAVSASDGRCPAYFAAGEHEAKIPLFIRDPATGGCATGTPPAHLGLRLVRDDPINLSRQ